MFKIAEADIQIRIERDNPWWNKKIDEITEGLGIKRAYYQPFKAVALNYELKRATILLGPRRVGKTYMIKQLVREAIELGIDPRKILYVSVDTPVYSGISLEKFLAFLPAQLSNGRALVIYDEIQYHVDWERHLKDLVDNYPNVKFVASGSAAAALKRSSKESGAGRFTDFMLPPLTFFEFLCFLGEDTKFIHTYGVDEAGRDKFTISNIDGLNSRFVDYLNFGGYPEAVVNDEIRKNPDQFIKNDIIDKVLLKDLPSLYGITEIQELNRLFSVLAYNAGNEASLENLSQNSGLTKPTIRRYVEYLESAFLIIKVATVDDNCRTMKRERNFKVYLNNPSMRAALFAPVQPDDHEGLGRLTECAIFSQWQHSASFPRMRYARWKNAGEVDIVFLSGDEKPLWIGEVKWSDRIEKNWADEIRPLHTLLKKHRSISDVIFTTRTLEKTQELDGRRFRMIPSSAYCYIVGKNITSRLENAI